MAPMAAIAALLLLGRGKGKGKAKTTADASRMPPKEMAAPVRQWRAVVLATAVRVLQRWCPSYGPYRYYSSYAWAWVCTGARA